MGFKIDTTTHFTTILPEAPVLDASLSGMLRTTCQKLCAEAPQNLIIDFSGTESISEDAFEVLTGIHEDGYAQDCSVVFTTLPEAALRQLKSQDLHHILNITPTMQEAIDMVMMENMERDLFNEES